MTCVHPIATASKPSRCSRRTTPRAASAGASWPGAATPPTAPSASASCDRLTADLPAPPRPRRRRRAPILPLAILALALAAWLVIVPPEVTLALVLVFSVLAMLAVFLLAPLWIPVVLAFVAYRLIRRG